MHANDSHVCVTNEISWENRISYDLVRKPFLAHYLIRATPNREKQRNVVVTALIIFIPTTLTHTYGKYRIKNESVKHLGDNE